MLDVGEPVSRILPARADVGGSPATISSASDSSHMLAFSAVGRRTSGIVNCINTPKHEDDLTFPTIFPHLRNVSSVLHVTYFDNCHRVICDARSGRVTLLGHDLFVI
jgi:hypothetical protein